MRDFAHGVNDPDIPEANFLYVKASLAELEIAAERQPTVHVSDAEWAQLRHYSRSKSARRGY